MGVLVCTNIFKMYIYIFFLERDRDGFVEQLGAVGIRPRMVSVVCRIELWCRTTRSCRHKALLSSSGTDTKGKTTCRRLVSLGGLLSCQTKGGG